MLPLEATCPIPVIETVVATSTPVTDHASVIARALQETAPGVAVKETTGVSAFSVNCGDGDPFVLSD